MGRETRETVRPGVCSGVVRGLWGLVVVAVAGCGTPGGPPSVELEALTARRPVPAAFQPVAFLPGCWRGHSTSGGTVIEERWGPPSENVMLGTTRFLRDGRTVQFEFGHMRAGPEGVVYTPYPDGERSEHAFRLTSSGPGEAVFEAPEHDYPKRIRYRLEGEAATGRTGRAPRGLRIEIDGGEGDSSPRSWVLREVRCEGFPAI